MCSHVKQYGSLPLLLLLLLFFANCEESINPLQQENNNYAIMGPLYLDDQPSYIRVHDTRASLNAQSTRTLNITLKMTDLSSGSTTILQDSIKQFNEIFTHNFVIKTPIKYNNRYRFTLEDEAGVTRSFTSVTTKRANLAITKDLAKCEEPLEIELSNLDLTAGEMIREEVGIQFNDQWYWESIPADRVFLDEGEENERLRLSWIPNAITETFQSGYTYHNYAASCDELSSEIIQFRITHIGYMEDEEVDEAPENPDLDVDPVNVKSTYTIEGQFRIDPAVFDKTHTERLPVYYRQKPSIKQSFNFGSKWRMGTNAVVLNTNERPNIFYLDTEEFEVVNQSRFLPYISVSLNINGG
jgi:hypothetical protein